MRFLCSSVDVRAHAVPCSFYSCYESAKTAILLKFGKEHKPLKMVTSF